MVATTTLSRVSVTPLQRQVTKYADHNKGFLALSALRRQLYTAFAFMAWTSNLLTFKHVIFLFAAMKLMDQAVKAITNIQISKAAQTDAGRAELQNILEEISPTPKASLATRVAKKLPRAVLYLGSAVVDGLYGVGLLPMVLSVGIYSNSNRPPEVANARDKLAGHLLKEGDEP